MLNAICIIAVLSPRFDADMGLRVALTESTRTETTKTVTQTGSSSMTEESTSVQSRWKFEATIPFSATDWAQLGQDGTVSLKIGKQLLETKVSTGAGFNPKRRAFEFNLTRPVVASSGFKYLTLPTDMPPAPVPPAGTRVVYGQGSLEFQGSTLKIVLVTSDKSCPSLAGEDFQGVNDGRFEGELPMVLTAGTHRLESELKITGSAKHRDSNNDESIGTTIVGHTVQISLTGRV